MTAFVEERRGCVQKIQREGCLVRGEKANQGRIAGKYNQEFLTLGKKKKKTWWNHHKTLHLGEKYAMPTEKKGSRTKKEEEGGLLDQKGGVKAELHLAHKALRKKRRGRKMNVKNAGDRAHLGRAREKTASEKNTNILSEKKEQAQLNKP